MKKLAMATDIAHIKPEGPGVVLLCDLLEQRGIDVIFVPWDAGIDWQLFDMVLIRQTWDYHLRLPEFRAWLQSLEQQQVPVWNPVPLINWNAHKQYLLDLAADGIALPALELLRQGTTANLQAILEQHGWQKAVIKPAVSAAAHHTWIASPRSVKEDTYRLNTLLQQTDFIIQEFLEEVVTGGEYSFLFFNGVFSHAVLKKARKGDYRVQEAHGGTTLPVTINREQLEQAQRVIDTIKLPFLYARVDGVFRGTQLLLMELELIEPSLYLEGNEAAVRRMADAVAVRMQQQPSGLMI